MLWSFQKEDITPPEGLWQDGYANRAHSADGVLDPLSVRVCAVQSGDSAFLMLALETLVLTEDRANALRKRVADSCDVGVHQVLAAATHTHSAPMSLPTEREEDYEDWWESVLTKAVSACRRAMKSLQPARFDTVSGLARIGINRREFTEKGVMIGENPKAVIDRNLRVLRVVSEDGRLMGVVMQSACHAVCMMEKNTKYTGDWPGRVCRVLEEQNDGVVALYFNGGCGDVNPKRYEGESDTDCLNRTSALFLEDVVKLLKKPFQPHDDGPIASADSVLDVPLRKLDRDKLIVELKEWRKRMLVAPDDSWDKIIGVYCGRFTENAIQHIDAGKPALLKATVQAARLAGDVAVLALPFEILSSTSRELMLALEKQGLSRSSTFIIGYANGIHGHLPTARAIREGGHEPVISAWYYNLPSYYSPRAEQQVRSRLLALWEETKTQD